VTGRTLLAAAATSPDAADLALSVTVTRHGAALLGRLSLRWATGAAPAMREVRAASCSEVLDALAFVAALAIDPRAQATPTNSATTPPTTQASPPPAQPEVSEATPPAPASEDVARDPASTAPRAPLQPARWYGSVGMAAELGTASSGPGPLLGVRFGVGAGLRFNDALSAELHLEGVRRASAAERASGQVQFTLLALRLSPCLRRALGSGISAHACAGGEFGTLSAEASGVTNAKSAAPTWIALTAGVGAGVEIVDGLGVGAEAAALVPTKRDRFVFVDRSQNQDAEVFVVPAVAASGALFVQARLP
jgi:hypothetical protein